MAYGPGESRLVEEKRHKEKPIPISDLVLLDRERCILCDRCTRFADEVAGDPLIHFIDRGNDTEINTFPDEPFSSYFCGNTVQICPVGALTAEPYRFKARPWDLETTESTCQTCSVGCRISIDSSRDQVLRYAGRRRRPGELGLALRQGPLRLRGRRSRRPPRRAAGPRRRHPRPRPLGRCPAAAPPTRLAGGIVGPTAIGVIGGARLTNEDAYAWAKLAKGVIGTDNVDAQLGDGLPAEVVLGLPRATIDEVCAPGGTVLVLAPDLKEELPVLFLRLRHAVVNDGVHPHRGGAPLERTHLARAASLLPRPGESGELVRALVAQTDAARDVAGVGRGRHRRGAHRPRRADGPLTRGPGPAVARRGGRRRGRRRFGRPRRPARRPLPLRSAAGQRPRRPRHGPGPGPPARRVSLADGRDWFAGSWPTVPDRAGPRHRRDPAGRRRRPHRRAGAAGRRSRWPTSPTATWPSGPWPAPAPSSPSTPSSPTRRVGRRRRAARRRVRREGRHHDQHRGSGQRAGPASHPAGHRPGGLDDRRRAGPPPRRRPRLRLAPSEILSEIEAVAPSTPVSTVARRARRPSTASCSP